MDHSIKGVVAQIASLSTMTTWILGSIITILIAMVMGMGTLWREDGIHGQELLDIQQILKERSSYESRMVAMESTRFTVADGHHLALDLAAKSDTLRSDIMALKHDIAILKSKGMSK